MSFDYRYEALEQMAVRHGYIGRIDLHVLNVVGTTSMFDLQLAFAELADRLKQQQAPLRVLVDLSAARLDGTLGHLNFFLSALQAHTDPAVVVAETICIIIMDRCPLRRELVPMSDVFASKLSLLGKRHPAFVITRGRGDAVDALDTANLVP